MQKKKNKRFTPILQCCAGSCSQQRLANPIGNPIPSNINIHNLPCRTRSWLLTGIRYKTYGSSLYNGSFQLNSYGGNSTRGQDKTFGALKRIYLID